jgi:hypothetical protein
MASRRRDNPLKNQKAKIKKQNDRAKFKNVVRGFSPVHDPEGSHYKKRVYLTMTRGECHCGFLLSLRAKRGNPLKNQKAK